MVARALLLLLADLVPDFGEARVVRVLLPEEVLVEGHLEREVLGRVARLDELELLLLRAAPERAAAAQKTQSNPSPRTTRVGGSSGPTLRITTRVRPPFRRSGPPLLR